MRRIYAAWFVRTVASPAAVKAAIVLALLWRLKEYVSIRHVIANAPSLWNPFGNLIFFETAFFHTHLAVQGLVLASAIFALWLLRDLIKGYALLLMRTA